MNCFFRTCLFEPLEKLNLWTIKKSVDVRMLSMAKYKQEKSYHQKSSPGTSLVVLWLRICLPMQGTLVWYPDGGTKIPHMMGATKPTCHSYRAYELWSVCHNQREAHASQRTSRCSQKEILKKVLLHPVSKDFTIRGVTLTSAEFLCLAQIKPNFLKITDALFKELKILTMTVPQPNKNTPWLLCDH